MVSTLRIFKAPLSVHFFCFCPNKRVLFFFLLFVLMASKIGFCFVFLLAFSLSFSAADPPKKVSLGLYYETLCPYCSNFMVNYLPKIFQNGLLEIVDLNLVPYGNARLGANESITCQHGPYECLLNTVEACVINIWPDLHKHYAFIFCVETLVVERKYTEWESCFDKTGFNSQPVADCYNNGYGKQLELKYAAETNALQPPHRYVPWVVVDGRPLYEDYENFEAYICKAYKGTPPKVCKSVHLITPQKQREELGRVSYAKETRDSSAVLIRRRMEIERLLS